MGLRQGRSRQWWRDLREKAQDKRLFTSMCPSLGQDLLKDGHMLGQLGLRHHCKPMSQATPTVSLLRD